MGPSTSFSDLVLLKKKAANEPTKQKDTHRIRNQTYGCQEEGIVGEFGKVMYILLLLLCSK